MFFVSRENIFAVMYFFRDFEKISEKSTMVQCLFKGVVLASDTILNQAQQEVMDHGLLTSGFSCILQMPTGSGKTWLAENGIRDVISKGGRAIYLAPVRALASQIYVRWRDQFGVPVGIFTGEYGAGKLKCPTSLKDARVLIMTPERLDACTRMWRSHWQYVSTPRSMQMISFHP